MAKPTMQNSGCFIVIQPKVRYDEKQNVCQQHNKVRVVSICVLYVERNPDYYFVTILLEGMKRHRKEKQSAYCDMKTKTIYNIKITR